MKYLILALLLIGCGHEGPDIDPALKGAVDRYLARAPSKGDWDELISIDWGDTGSKNRAGLCIKKKNRFLQTERKVRISRQMRDYTDALDVVVAHELGHCLHRKHHDDSKGGLIMNTVLKPVSDMYWAEHYNEQMDYMFDPIHLFD